LGKQMIIDRPNLDKHYAKIPSAPADSATIKSGEGESATVGVLPRKPRRPACHAHVRLGLRGRTRDTDIPCALTMLPAGVITAAGGDAVAPAGGSNEAMAWGGAWGFAALASRKELEVVIVQSQTRRT